MLACGCLSVYAVSVTLCELCLLYGRACAADCAGLRLRGCVAGARLTAVWTVRMSDSKNCIYSNMLYFPGYDL